jgi:hypothetical protein
MAIVRGRICRRLIFYRFSFLNAERIRAERLSFVGPLARQDWSPAKRLYGLHLSALS